MKQGILFYFGGSLYVLTEVLYRQKSHAAMFFVGGICFLFLGMLNERFSFEMPLIKQGLIGAVFITGMEFAAGILCNRIFHWDIWDYSDVPFQFMGQICLPFSILWFFLSLLAVIADDYLRFYLFGEEKPHYHILGGDGRGRSV